jgi:hypothetical protein
MKTAFTIPTDLGMENPGPARRLAKRLVFDPLANYLPAALVRGLLKFGKSQLAAANWADPGGWRSMVISYDNKPVKEADRIMVSLGSMPMALRNRKRLGAYLIAQLIAETPVKPAHVLCLGAGPGRIIMDALEISADGTCATLVDLSSDAFDYGMELAKSKGLDKQVKYIQADVRDIKKFLHVQPTIVKMIGICEYLTDEQIVGIAQAVAEVMPPQAAIIFNTVSPAHGTDRFFRRVFGLHMFHRTPEQLMAQMASAGFGEFHVYPEPLGVFHVVVGTKVKS